MTDHLIDDLQQRVSKYVEEHPENNLEVLTKLRAGNATLVQYGLDINNETHYQLLKKTLEARTTALVLRKPDTSLVLSDSYKIKYLGICERVRDELLNIFDTYLNLPSEEYHSLTSVTNKDLWASFQNPHEQIHYYKFTFAWKRMELTQENRNTAESGLFNVKLNHQKKFPFFKEYSSIHLDIKYPHNNITCDKDFLKCCENIYEACVNSTSTSLSQFTHSFESFSKLPDDLNSYMKYCFEKVAIDQQKRAVKLEQELSTFTSTLEKIHK